MAEGTRLLSEYGVHAPSRVRIPPSPLPVPTDCPSANLNAAAPVAQLDRASVYGTEGHRFESCRARYRSRQIVSIYRDFVSDAQIRGSSFGSS